MKILITGSEGTIGTSLKAELEKRGHEVWGLDLQHGVGPRYVRADVANYRQLGNAFGSFTPDVVYHLAAEFGRLNGEEFFETLWNSNVIGTRNVLELQRLLGFKLIFASSSEIYGEVPLSALSENLSEEIPLRQPNDYAMSKYVNEQQIMNFETLYGNQCVRLRFFNAYGPGEHYHNYRSVVCLFAYRALHGLPYDVYEGYSRAFMYIDDFIPTLANVCENFKAGEVYNIGGNEVASVHELSDLVLKTVGVDDRHVRYLTNDRHSVVNKVPDCSKAARDFGHAPKVLLAEGVPATIEWMRQVYSVPVLTRA